MPHDAEAFGNQFAPYRADPMAETMRAIAALRTDAGYARSYAQLLLDMVYGEQAAYATCLATLNELAGHLSR